MPKTLRRTTTTTCEVTRVAVAATAPLRAWCWGCQQEVAFVSPTTAGAQTGWTQRQLFRAVEAGQVHFVETTDGQLWLCPASLPVPSEG